MNALSGIKEVVESAKSKFADSPLGKKAEHFEKDKTKNYDAPLGKEKSNLSTEKVEKWSKEEYSLLRKLKSGELDGLVGDERYYSGGITCGKYIKDGVPISYREGKTTKFFNGKENEKVPGKREEERYDTDEKKIEFLKKYGWLMDDVDVKKYSAKFKPY